MSVEALRDAVGRAVGVRVTAAVAVGGGDVARAGRFVLADGRSVFAKSVAGPRGMLAAEAAGLAWLREGLATGLGTGPVTAATDDGGWPVQVPRVLAVVDDDTDPLDAGPGVGDGSGGVGEGLDDEGLRATAPVEPRSPVAGEPSLLVLEWVPTERGPADGEALARGLAALHRSGARRFGLGRTTWCGPIPQDNRPADDWPTFYAEQRLRPLTRLALDAGRLDATTAAAVERVADRMHRLAGPTEPPSRLHGDLWSGNVVHGSDGRPWLVDPAAHAGHREVDLAMLRLFGGVDDRVFAAYDEVHPLAPGADERVRLWQLAPLLVHATLFGGGYASAVAAVAAEYG